jgi:hypothetical protein
LEDNLRAQAIKDAEDKAAKAEAERKNTAKAAEAKALQDRLDKAEEVLRKAEQAKVVYDEQVRKLQQQQQQPPPAAAPADDGAGTGSGAAAVNWKSGGKGGNDGPSSWHGQQYDKWANTGGRGDWQSGSAGASTVQWDGSGEADQQRQHRPSERPGGAKDMRSVLGSITAAARYKDSALRRKAGCVEVGGRIWVSLQDTASWSGQALEDIEKAFCTRGRGKQGRGGYFYTMGVYPNGQSYATVAEQEEREAFHMQGLGCLGKLPHQPSAGHPGRCGGSPAERSVTVLLQSI